MLGEAVDVLLKYKKLCERSYGPNALKNIFVTATGQVELTNDGAAILRCLNLQHPVAHLIKESLIGFHAKYGDGTKTLLFLVAETIAQIDRTITRSKEVQQIEKLKFVRALQKLQYSLIDDHVLKNIKLEKYSMTSMKPNDETATLLKNLISTKLQGSLDSHSCSHLSTLLIDLLLRNCSDEGDIKPCLQALYDSSQTIFVDQVGGLPWQSCFVDGVILPRQFHDFACPQQTLKDVRFTLMSLDFDTDECDQDAVITIRDASFLDDILHWKSRVYRLLVDHWRNLNINLVISNCRVPDQLALLLAKRKIYVVNFCPEFDIERLSFLSGCTLTSELQDVLSNFTIGSAQSCELIPVSGRSYVKLSGVKNCVDTPESSAKYISGHILVNGPSPGACQQIRTVLTDTCKLLVTCVGDNIDKPKSDIDCDDTEHSNQTIDVIEGGGAFELAMYHLLSSPLPSYQEDGTMLTVLKILAQSYITVPLLLLQNSHRPSAPKSSITDVFKMSPKPNEFPFTPRGIDARSGAGLMKHRNIIEPLNLKIGQWHHLIMIVSQLLRLDGIQSVRGSLQKISLNDDEDED